jgi:hypothetical protein
VLLDGGVSSWDAYKGYLVSGGEVQGRWVFLKIVVARGWCCSRVWLLTGCVVEGWCCSHVILLKGGVAFGWYCSKVGLVTGWLAHGSRCQTGIFWSPFDEEHWLQKDPTLG